MHLLIVALIVMLLFGPKRLPELGRSLGAGVRGFKHSLEGGDEEDSTEQQQQQQASPTEKPSGR
jgi:sec-independent protein translocase protein TatA